MSLHGLGSSMTGVLRRGNSRDIPTNTFDGLYRTGIKRAFGPADKDAARAYEIQDAFALTLICPSGIG